MTPNPSLERGPPPAWHLAREALVLIIRLAGQAPSRLRPLSSNVRPHTMQRHYSGLAARMLSEIDTISSEMSHQGEKGRNNEAILIEFLRRLLPTRYTVTTGKVVGVGGHASGQIDVIIHDRLDTPAFKEAQAWSIVPVESVHAVISVKTTLTKAELRDAMASLASVRSLPRKAARLEINGALLKVPEKEVLRPRAFIFAFKASWRSSEAFGKAFLELLSETGDDLRPNAACALDLAFLARRPYSLDVRKYEEHMLLHFFLFLVKSLESRPRYRPELSKYIAEDYEQGSGA